MTVVALIRTTVFDIMRRLHGGDHEPSSIHTVDELPIHKMNKCHPVLTKEIAHYNLQAVRFCLGTLDYPSANSNLKRKRNGTLSLVRRVKVKWTRPSQKILRAWEANKATEVAAEACALAAVKLLYGLVGMSRAEKRQRCGLLPRGMRRSVRRS